MDTWLDTPTTRRAAPHRRPWPLRWLQAAHSSWQAARRRAADRRVLQSMGEAELRDLGIGRCEAHHITQPGAKARSPR